tara:strand:+ start:1189 stop:1371 length:183 start_codon:yes stop_codon:yes gene_type:complete
MIEAIRPIDPVSVYYENRISYDQKWERMISIVETPHITYDKNGNLIQVPDNSWGVGSKYV